MRALSGKEFAKTLGRHGWIRVSIHSSHHRIVVVPIHGNRTLKQGLQHGLMKDAGLTEADL